MPPLRGIRFSPAAVLARVGNSDVPLEAFTCEEDPRSFGAGYTVAIPQVSMEVMPDGSLEVYLPRDLRFKDGQAVRPVCPFIELHAQFEGADEVPLTEEILHANGFDLSSLSFRIRAVNRKAARRTGDEGCSFEAREMVRGDDHLPRKLLAYTHAPSPAPLVSAREPIPLGSFQMIRPSRRGTRRLGVELDALRVRFTPGKGAVYGPPFAIEGQTSDSRRKHIIVPPQNRILNPDAGWTRFSYEQPPTIGVQPGQTYDGESDVDREDVSWGVVDDTCEASIIATLEGNGKSFTASTLVIVGPPQFAPDRRPFFSFADELADRDQASVPELGTATAEELGAAVHDLFLRIMESSSGINLERQRLRSCDDNTFLQAAPAPGFPAIDKDSMTEGDKISGRDMLSPYAAELLATRAGEDSRGQAPLVRSDIGREQHQRLAELDYLVSFLLTDEQRFWDIVRPPYAPFKDLPPEVERHAPRQLRDPRSLRDIAHDFRMPPYMRDSDLTALSITYRQFRILQLYVEKLKEEQRAAPTGLSQTAPAGGHVKRVRSRRVASGKGEYGTDRH